MSNEALCYYVNRDGSHGAASQLPDGALPIGFEQYQLLRENPGLIDVKVEGNVIHIGPSLISYKKSAAESIRREMKQHIPDETRLNRLARAVLCRQGCFDETSSLLLTFEETQGNLESLNEHLNSCLYLQAKYISKVDLAEGVLEVDGILNQFERTLQGIV